LNEAPIYPSRPYHYLPDTGGGRFIEGWALTDKDPETRRTMASTDAPPPTVDTPVEETQNEGSKLKTFLGILRKYVDA
jgi:hypothetical protein